ncbi:MAG: serine hydrolase [Cyclobacteriaceae bacterium]|nr:serine hydrolase [Cyclobacteriaceae bacterium]UYN86493.1 MAG: serine hydrolase [Cyclobacteriaceae bacterium]
MRYFFILTILFITGCNRPSGLASLKEQIKNELGKNEGTFAVAFKDLQTGDTLLINARQNFHAASTMKTPVMIEVYKQVAQGKLSLSDSIDVKNEFHSIVDGSLYQLDLGDDSEQDLYAQVGSKQTLANLVYEMIIVSSNLATNIVIELVDAKKVTETMRTLGAMDIQVLRGVEDGKAFEQGLNNTTTAYDLLLIFEHLAKRNIVNQEACEDMTRILMDQKFKEIIPAKLPAEVKVAHKTGSITGVRHDSGIIFLPDGRKYVLVLLSKGMTDPEAGVEAMATVSRMIYDYVIRN